MQRYIKHLKKLVLTDGENEILVVLLKKTLDREADRALCPMCDGCVCSE
jgi:hypothetical protein